MRIGIEAGTLSGRFRSGVWVYLVNVLRQMVARHPEHEYRLYSNVPIEPGIVPELPACVSFLRRPSTAWLHALLPLNLLRDGVDVFWGPRAMLPWFMPVPGVATLHDFTYARCPHTMQSRHAGLQRAHTAAAVASARRVITDSATVAREFESRYHRRADVIPLGVAPRFLPAAPGDVARVRERHGLRKPYVLAVGTLEPRKALAAAVRAHARLSQLNGWRGELAVAGPGGWGFERPADPDVRWLGFVDEADLPALYTGAELLVFPSVYEGFGLPLVEAMACGTPVLCSDIPVFREVAGDAAVFSPPDTLADSMNALLHDPARRRAMADRGRARARLFSWERTADRTLDVLAEAAR